MRLHQILKPVILFSLCIALGTQAFAQQPNPVERTVANPITDTPNVNPITQEEIKPSNVRRDPNAAPGDEGVVVQADNEDISYEKGNRIGKYNGNVDVRLGIYRLQADKLTVYEATGKIVAEGNVVFDQGSDQRITGTKSEWNYKTKLGYFENSTGFTNQTNDGTIIYFTASRVERTSLTEIVAYDAKVTACDENVPKWSFTMKKATIRTNDKVILRTPIFRIKDVPVIPLPYATISLKKRDRQSGFLIPTIGQSSDKGFRVSNAYYQTLGRSADATVRLDAYSARGIGLGVDARTRANSRSYFNFGFYVFKDRIFGAKATPSTPDQGGSLLYAQGVHYFPNGFTASADVRITSSIAFRQVFSDSIQQIISPIEISQVFVNKSWDNYTLNVLARSQAISIPNVQIKTKNLPSINFEKRPSELSFFKRAYFSFKTSLEGVSRRESVDSLAAYQAATGGDPIVTPSIGQRFDFKPQISIPFNTKYFTLTATGSLRSTYYSDSLDGFRRVVGNSLIRTYGEVELDLRPVALARNFYGNKNRFLFRHTVEPFLRYRYIKGVNDFKNIIRFDYIDTETDTNEIEYGVTNRFFTRRYSEAVTPEAQKRLSENPGTADPLSIQPYEIFTLTIRGKYFFDPTFGGALVNGRRNQIASFTDLTFYSFGSVARKFSPINIDATYRPRKTYFVSAKLDIGTQGEGVRSISTTIGFDSKLLKIFQTYYYTRAVTLMPSLQQFANADGKEPGTLRGSQYSPSIFAGNRDAGLYGGVSLYFDFENRRPQGLPALISSNATVGYSWDCCGVAVQAFTFNLGARRENRFVFSFKLNGIGTFGTQQLGQSFY